jgi:hypothetical protein
MHPEELKPSPFVKPLTTPTPRKAVEPCCTPLRRVGARPNGPLLARSVQRADATRMELFDYIEVFYNPR